MYPVAGENEKTSFTKEEVDAMIAENVAGLKANRDEALADVRKAKATLKNYEGVDPEEHKRLKAEAAAAEQKKATAEGDFSALKKQLIDQHQSELGGKDSKIGKLTSALEKRLVEAELTNSLVKNGARKDMLDLLVLRGRDSVRVRETDDDFEQYVSDSKGNPRIADGKGTAMSIDDFVVTDLRTKYPAAFEGSGSSGGGATKSTSGTGGQSKTLSSGDGKDFLANVGAIAKKEMTVKVDQV